MMKIHLFIRQLPFLRTALVLAVLPLLSAVPAAGQGAAVSEEGTVISEEMAEHAASHGVTVAAGKTFLRQLQKRDSVLIADQLFYGFRLDGIEEGTRLVYPDLSENFTPGVEVVGTWKTDTLKTKRGKKGMCRRYDIESGVVITSFDEGDYELAPLAVLRLSEDGTADTLFFESSLLQVRTMPVDTASFTPHDIKTQIRYPLTFREVLPWLLGVNLLAMLIATIWALVKLYRRRSDPEYARKDPAHIVALRKLDHFRGEKMWTPEKQKSSYSGVTDALREYICARYGISAMEKTTAEIFNEMNGTDAPKELVGRIKELFETADFVKFAKLVVPDSECTSVLPLAVRFVTETYQSEIQADAASGSASDSVSVSASDSASASAVSPESASSSKSGETISGASSRPTGNKTTEPGISGNMKIEKGSRKDL